MNIKERVFWFNITLLMHSIWFFFSVWWEFTYIFNPSEAVFFIRYAFLLLRIILFGQFMIRRLRECKEMDSVFLFEEKSGKIIFSGIWTIPYTSFSTFFINIMEVLFLLIGYAKV